MKQIPGTFLQRSEILLELARSRSDTIWIRWRSVERSEWQALNPRWRRVGEKLRFQFEHLDRTFNYEVSSIRQYGWGIRVFLADSRSPIPEAFDIVWGALLPDRSDPRRLWEIARRWLLSEFPGHRVISAAKRPDLAHTLSGAFLRVHFRHGGKDCFLVAAGAAPADDTQHAIGQALLWLSTLPVSARLASMPALFILVPSGNSAVLFHRCSLLSKERIRPEVWEYGSDDPEAPEFLKAAMPPPPEEEKDFRWPVLGPFRWSSLLGEVLNLAPALIRRYPRFQDYDSLRLWGLEFAQVMGAARDRIVFGVGEHRAELTEDNFDMLRSLIGEILYFRRPDSPDIRHPYYRLQAERWMEALVLEDIPGLFPELAPEAVYSQIPVYLGGESGRIDILGADRQGTLVVMELKVVPNPDLPVQALDYWGRVVQHNENGDFERRGYFSEIRLTRQRPRIYLVSPVFSFHDTTESLLRYLDPDLEVWKISINEDWRCGIKIVRRIRY